MPVSALTYLIAAVVAIQLIVVSSPAIYIAYKGAVYRADMTLELLSALRLSVLASLISSLFVLALSIPVGYALSRERAFVRRSIFPFLLLFSAMSPASVGLILLLFFSTSPIGLALQRSVGIINNWKGIIIAQFTLVLPLGISYFASIFSTVPRSLEETGFTMGYSREELLFRALVPMMKAEVIMGFIVIFTRAFGDFGASFILGGGIRGRTVTLPIYLYYAYQTGELALASFVLIAYIISSASILALLGTLYVRGGRVAIGA